MKNVWLTLCFSFIVLNISAQSLTDQDREFTHAAAQAGLLEVKLAELSVERAASTDVKNLGQMMVVDHTKANNELKALAVSKNITLPTQLSDEGQKIYNELSAKKGADFDKAYARLMVTNHEKSIARFKAVNLGNSDTEIRNWVSVTLPVLEHHLMLSKDADLKLNK